MVLKPYEDLPGLEVHVGVVEDSEDGLEAVGLVGWIGGGDLPAGGVGVGDEDAVAGIGGRGGSFGGGLGEGEWQGGVNSEKSEGEDEGPSRGGHGECFGDFELRE